MNGFTIRISDVERCPIRSLSPRHFNTDGSCACHDAWAAELNRGLDVCPLCGSSGRDVCVTSGGRAYLSGHAVRPHTVERWPYRCSCANYDGPCPLHGRLRDVRFWGRF